MDGFVASSRNKTKMMLLSASVATCAVSVVALLLRREKALRKALERSERLRSEERRGRTRAEIALRNQSKQKVENRQEPIGKVRSPFVKRAGTPRQGSVCPAGRGLLFLDKSQPKISPAALDGLEDYSHIWLIFEFHANTDINSKTAKVQPPRGYGKRVGWLATRTPHRSYPIGLSLVVLHKVNHQALTLELRGIDLCDNTPILDIKPCLPWDLTALPDLRLPQWVSQNDAFESVQWSSRALHDLQVHAHYFADFYPESDIDQAKATIDQLLAQDPRSKKCRNNTKASNTPFNVPFAGLLVFFQVLHHTTVSVLSLIPLHLYQQPPLHSSLLPSPPAHRAPDSSIHPPLSTSPPPPPPKNQDLLCLSPSLPSSFS